jgi:hypothetical protein
VTKVEKILYVPVMIAATAFVVGGIIYAYADHLRLSRRAELAAGLTFGCGGVALFVIAVVAFVLKVFFGMK